MDPNANLQEQERIISAHNPGAYVNAKLPEWRRLLELRQALYDWLRDGGFEPDWTTAPNARQYYGR
jgi:hypothetical protein